MAVLNSSLFGSLAAEAAALVKSLCRSVVHVQDRRGNGSGVIWESDGLIVTNHHVVGRDEVRVELADGRDLPATVVAREPHNDLAALRVPARDLPAAPRADTRA